MANKAIDWALRQAVNATLKLVLLILANRANSEDECFPSLSTICRESSLSRSAVVRALDKLESLTLIRRTKRPYKSTIYTLLSGPREGLVLDKNQSLTRTKVVLQKDHGSPQEGLAVVPHEDRNPQLNPKRTQREPKYREGSQKTRAPAELPITDSMRLWAREKEIIANLEEETEAMLDHYRAKGETRVDWSATWRMWMRNSKKFGGNNGNSKRQQRESHADAKNRRTRENAESFLADLAADEARGSLQRGNEQTDLGGLHGEFIYVSAKSN